MTHKYYVELEEHALGIRTQLYFIQEIIKDLEVAIKQRRLEKLTNESRRLTGHSTGLERLIRDFGRVIKKGEQI